MGNSFHHIHNPTEEIETKHHLRELQKEESEIYLEPRAPKDPKFYRDHDLRPDPTLQAVWFKSPFTELLDAHMNLQHNPLCGKVELGMMNCLEAYGLPKGFYTCRDLLDDYNECITENKRFKRCKVMRQERARQHRLGEREIKYAMPPKPGSLQL